MNSESKRSFIEKLEAGSDRSLTLAETFLVLAFAVIIALVSLLTLIWILWTSSLQVEQQRLTAILVTLNENWKAVLLLMVPLFYRTARKLVARITKLPLGMEAAAEDEKAKPETVADKPNPHPVAQITRD